MLLLLIHIALVNRVDQTEVSAGSLVDAGSQRLPMQLGCLELLIYDFSGVDGNCRGLSAWDLHARYLGAWEYLIHLLTHL